MVKIGIILGSTREGRVSPQVGAWVKEIADKRGDAEYEIIDIADFKLPFLGEAGGDTRGTRKLVSSSCKTRRFRIHRSRI
ncbi:NAD(P)H-dependent FMN reductase OS=Ureibacillus acetophenoni OX=614649 GN=SAMN05877842_10640 PE=4 SV=1 [Ureibacillus acetophenoni]